MSMNNLEKNIIVDRSPIIGADNSCFSNTAPSSDGICNIITKTNPTIRISTSQLLSLSFSNHSI